jgi:phosphatidylglycerol:prolipoprotein diacylglycerol transferase
MEQLFGIPVAPGIDPSTVLAVHPTQIYEVILMLAAFMLLWSLRKSGRPIGWIFGLYLVIAGVERFLIEILRAKDDRFLGPFTLAQLTSVVLIAIGIWIMMRLRQAEDPAPGPFVTTGRKAA